MDDADVWKFIDPDDLWVYDKLILAKKLNYLCGPAGVSPPKADKYVVRPCVNFQMMGHGASIRHLTPSDYDIPHGYFWCEKFEGRHLSFDFRNGKQVLAVEGFREDPQRLDRFSKWTKVDDVMTLPPCLEYVSLKYEWLNVETIGGHIIEVHLRYDDSFRNHLGRTIFPIWKDEFYPSECGDRIGFIVKNT